MYFDVGTETTTETNDVSTVNEAVTTVKEHGDMATPGDLTTVEEQPNLATHPDGLNTEEQFDVTTPPGGLATEEQPDTKMPPGGLTTTGQPWATVPIGSTTGIEVTPTDKGKTETSLTSAENSLAFLKQTGTIHLKMGSSFMKDEF